jgi:hypothetical protein
MGESGRAAKIIALFFSKADWGEFKSLSIFESFYVFYA